MSDTSLTMSSEVCRNGIDSSMVYGIPSFFYDRGDRKPPHLKGEVTKPIAHDTDSPKDAALEALPHNTHGPYRRLPRTAPDGDIRNPILEPV